MVSSAADVYPAQTRRSILDKHKHFTEQGTFILINRRWLLVCAACSRILSDRLAIYVLIPEKYFAPRSQILSDLLAIYVLIPENMYLKAWPWNLSKQSFSVTRPYLVLPVQHFEAVCFIESFFAHSFILSESRAEAFSHGDMTRDFYFM
ncbi:hypothetical protein CUMW_068990 [Citrus unshiu]|nr:hypothetical protein CUMW_068990 [Citrus unshiu]